MADFGSNLKRIRQEKEMTQMEVAVKSGLPLGTVVRIEAGGVNPRVDTADKIATALGVSITDLLSDRAQAG